MVGIKRLKLLLGILIPFFAFFVMSQNTSAYTATTFGISEYSNGGNWLSLPRGESNAANLVGGGTAYFNNLDGVRFVRLAQWGNGQYFAGNARIKVTFRQNSAADDYNFQPIVNNSGWSIMCGNGASFNSPYQFNVSNFNSSYVYGGSNSSYKFHSLVYTFAFNGQFQSSQSGNYDFFCSLTKDNGFVDIRYAKTDIYYEDTEVTMTVAVDESASRLDTVVDQNNTMISQNNTIINQNQQIINNSNEYYDKQDQAVDNIDNQSSSDIQGSDNQQTTSLINVISGFISAFSGITAGNCNLTLEFPNYAGGTRVVNICSGKEKAPRIVEIGSSLLLIVVFVPLAYILIKMIYNEIRSWTNG